MQQPDSCAGGCAVDKTEGEEEGKEPLGCKQIKQLVRLAGGFVSLLSFRFPVQGSQAEYYPSTRRD